MNNENCNIKDAVKILTPKTFRDEVFQLLNYIPDQTLVLWRGTQNLNTTNLLDFLKGKGVKSVCEVKLDFCFDLHYCC